MSSSGFPVQNENTGNTVAEWGRLLGEDDATVETSAITITTATVGDQMNPWRSELNQRVRNS